MTWTKIDDHGREKWKLADGRGQFIACVEQWDTCAWAHVMNLRWSGEFATVSQAMAECERRHFRWWMFWRKR